MFLSTYEAMRSRFLRGNTLLSVAHLGAKAFPEISGEVVKTQIHSALNRHVAGFRPTFFRLLEGDSEEKQASLLRRENKFPPAAKMTSRPFQGARFPTGLGIPFGQHSKQELHSLRWHIQPEA